MLNVYFFLFLKGNDSYFEKLNKSTIDFDLELERFLIVEKKMQMIQLKSKLDALSEFNGSIFLFLFLNYNLQ